MQNFYLTKGRRSLFVLPENFKSILVGLILGDLYIFKSAKSVNAGLRFEQGLVHKDYLVHLYDLFKTYPPEPLDTMARGKEIQWIFSPYLFRVDFFEIDRSRGRVVNKVLKSKNRTIGGKNYSSIFFNTSSLPCFTEFLIYSTKKIIPSNMA